MAFPTLDPESRRPAGRRALLAAVLVALVAAVLAPSAQAAASPCAGQALSQPFLPFLDPAQYTPVHDAGLEQGGRGWTLAAGARVVRDQEPWRVRRATDVRSLELPAGATATTAPLCVSLLHPTARLFARSTGLLGTVAVQAVLTDATGLVRSLPAGVIAAGPTWQASLPLPLLANLAAPLAGNRLQVQLRFTALTGDVRVDDVYVDPYKVI